MITPYHPDDSSETYRKYFHNQAGYGFNVFRGSTVHTGHGIGSFFGKLARSSLPLLKSAAKTALSTGARIAADALRGEDIGKSAVHHGKCARASLLDTLSGNLGDASDSPHHHTTPKRKKHKKSSQKKLTSILDNVNVRA